MKIEDYNEYYIQNSNHYLIPKDVFMELFNEMINWKEENKILRENAEHNDKVVDKVNWENQLLKKKYENAVADYETTMFEKEQLNSLVNSCQEEIRQLKKQLEEWITHLIEAKKMLDIQAQQGNYDFDEYMLGIYNGMEYIVSIFENREPEYISGTEVKFINNKQKEFI